MSYQLSPRSPREQYTPEKAEPQVKEAEQITEIDEYVLNTFIGEGWRKSTHKHLTFRSQAFNLKSINGLCLQPIDVSQLETLNVSFNQLTDLAALEGSSQYLRSMRAPQGLFCFERLQVLNAKHNRLTHFNCMLPLMRELDLSHNCFKELPPILGMPKLQVIFLSHNEMDGEFYGLSKLMDLKKFDLSSNKFSFMPSVLAEILEELGHLSSLQLKIHDNPFCTVFPMYQAFIVQLLPRLQKLDDVQDMKALAKAAETMHFNIKKFDEMFYNTMAQVHPEIAGVRGRNDAPAAQEHQHLHHNESKHHQFAAIAEFLARANEAPKTAHGAIMGLTRLTQELSVGNQEAQECLDCLEAELAKEPHLEAKLLQVLGGVLPLLKAEIELENRYLVALIVRGVAKLSVVDIMGLADAAAETLTSIVAQIGSLEDQVFEVVQEFLVRPLADDLDFEQASQHFGEDVPSQLRKLYGSARILTKFTTGNSARDAALLAPASAAIAKLYCSDLPDFEHKKIFIILVKRMSYSAENLKVAVDAVKGLPSEVINSMSQGSEAAEDASLIYTTVENMAKAKLEPIEKAFGFKSFHVVALRKLITAFGDKVPTQEEHPEIQAQRADLRSIRVNECISIGYLLGAIKELMVMSPWMLQELAEKQLNGLLIHYITAGSKAQTAQHPIFLSSSIDNIIVICEAFDKISNPTPSQVRILTKLAEALQSMKPVITSVEGGINFEDHWKALLEGKTVSQAEEESFLVRMLMAVYSATNFFGRCSNKSIFASAEEVFQKQRTDLVRKLFSASNPEVTQRTVNIVAASDLSVASAQEAADFVDLLKHEVGSALPYLAQVVRVLETFLKPHTSASGAGGFLQKKQTARCIKGVVDVLARSTKFKPENEIETEQHSHLQIACRSFLVTLVHEVPQVGLTARTDLLKDPELHNTVVAVLQSEPDSTQLGEPDITIERTWTGRTVETLLRALAGPYRVKARGKTAFRIVARIADVLEGRTDAKQQVHHALHHGVNQVMEDIGVTTPLPHFCILTHLADEELKPFDEGEVKKRERLMDDIEKDHWVAQQRIFGDSHGLERLLTFLEGMATDETGSTLMIFDEMAKAERAASSWFENLMKKLSDPDGESEDYSDENESNSSSLTEEEQEGTDEKVMQLADRDFKGDSDYVDLRSSYTLKVGGIITILLTARWDAFGYWSSVIDFGNGSASDNIVICNQGVSNTLVFEVYRGSVKKSLVVPGIIPRGEMCKYLFTVSERGDLTIMMNKKIIGEDRDNATEVAVPKKLRYLYVGKSCWPERAHFQGRVEELQVWQGKCFTWEQVVEEDDDMGETDLDRASLMKEFMDVGMNRSFRQKPPPKPEVYGAVRFAVTAGTSSKFKVEQDVFTGIVHPEGQTNTCFVLAATLRCCFAMLTAHAMPKVRSDMVATLRDKGTVSKLLALLRLVGPFNCECSCKFLHVMSIALDLLRGQPEVEMIQVYDMLADYMADNAEMAALAIQQTEDKDLAKIGLNLIEKITGLTAMILMNVPVCIESESDPQAKALFVDLCYRRFVRSEYVEELLQFIIFGSAYNTEQSKTISDNVTNILVKLLKCCQENRAPNLQALCSVMFSGRADVGPEFMTSLFETYQQSADADALELALSSQEFGSQEVEFAEGGNSERAIATAKVEVFLNQERLKAENPSREKATFTFIMTTKGVYILDATQTGYPEKSTGIVQTWTFENLFRLVKGHLSQALMLGFLSGVKERPEDTLIVVFHRPKDRDLFLGKIQKMKIAPCQDDTLTQKALEKGLQLEPPIMAVYTEPEVGWLSSSGKMLLYVLTQATIHKFPVNYERWMAPPDLKVEDQGKEKIDIEKNVARAQTDAISANNWNSAIFSLLREDGQPEEVWNLRDLDKVELYPDELPRIFYTFIKQSSFSIRFYDISSHDKWREAMIVVLQKLDPDSSWSKSAKGVQEPLALKR